MIVTNICAKYTGFTFHRKYHVFAYWAPLFFPGLKPSFLQILPTEAFLSSAELTPWIPPDCLPILLSISVFLIFLFPAC